MRARLRGKNWDIIFKRFKDRWGDCDHPTTKGKQIRLSTDHPDEKSCLSTVIHEAVHACFPDLNEEAVTEFGDDMAHLIYRLGWRLEE